jgi:hypothetical protein
MPLGRSALAAAIGLLLALAVPGLAYAQDSSSRLGDAESRAASAEAEIEATSTQVDAAEARYATASRRADPAREAARQAQAEVLGLRTDLLARQAQARGEISQLEVAHQEEVDDHDEEVVNGIGLGLAALVAAGIALGWSRFRASASVAALSEIDLGRAVARLLKRERMPAWVPRVGAGLLAVLCLGAFGSAIFSKDAASDPVSPQLREEATAAVRGPGARQLAAARGKAAALQRQAAGPLAKQEPARSALQEAERRLRDSERRLASAEADQRRFTRELAAQAQREEREAAKAAALAEREAEELADEEAERAAEECHPSYSGCLDPYSPDYDCEGGSGDGPDYTGTVEVIGYDEYELDDDGDGIGCDP